MRGLRILSIAVATLLVAVACQAPRATTSTTAHRMNVRIGPLIVSPVLDRTSCHTLMLVVSSLWRV